MTPAKSRKALQDMHDRINEQVCAQKANGIDVPWWQLRNMAALSCAIDTLDRLLDYVARQKAEGTYKGMTDAQFEAWGREVCGNPGDVVDIVAMMGE